MGRVLLDAVAPLRCAGCDQVSVEPICAACVARMTAQPLPRSVDLARGQAQAAFTFDAEVREVLHRGKFQSNRAALRQLASLSAGRLELSARVPPPDAIAATPLGERRRQQRGYNQAEVIAKVFAACAGVPMLSGLVRERETATQASRGEAARRANVAGAFGWRGAGLGGAWLWVVDDVLTTGATIEAAAGVLRRAGARQVDAVVIARVP